jgi:hypothetical protein
MFDKPIIMIKSQNIYLKKLNIIHKYNMFIKYKQEYT